MGKERERKEKERRRGREEGKEGRRGERERDTCRVDEREKWKETLMETCGDVEWERGIAGERRREENARDKERQQSSQLAELMQMYQAAVEGERRARLSGADLVARQQQEVEDARAAAAVASAELDGRERGWEARLAGLQAEAGEQLRRGALRERLLRKEVEGLELAQFGKSDRLVRPLHTIQCALVSLPTQACFGLRLPD